MTMPNGFSPLFLTSLILFFFCLPITPLRAHSSKSYSGSTFEEYQEWFEEQAQKEAREYDAMKKEELLAMLNRGEFGTTYRLWYSLAAKCSVSELKGPYERVLNSSKEYLIRYHCAASFLEKTGINKFQPVDLSDQDRPETKKNLKEFFMLVEKLVSEPVPVQTVSDKTDSPIGKGLKAFLRNERADGNLTITYSDIHGLHGGEAYTLNGSGNLDIQIIGKGAASKTRHLSRDQVSEIVSLLLETEAWVQKVRERPPVPDESTARLSIQVGGAESHIWEWYNDLGANDRLEKILEAFRALARP